MKMYYITLNNHEEAQKISHALLESKLAVCTNWFPITCAYRWEGDIKQGSEIVLIVKTQQGLRNAIENVVSDHIDYTNYMAELNVDSVNQSFLQWLNNEVRTA